MRAPIALLGLSVLAGCTAHSPPKPNPLPAPVIENNKPARVGRHLTLAWDNIGRGGAAMREPAYIHVLGEGFNEAQAQSKLSGADVMFLAQSNTHKAQDKINDADINETLNTFKSLTETKTKGQGYSLYELSRWERYCNRGKGMDERDWRFIEAGSTEHIPSEIIVGCHPPAYTYQDYLSAWTGFCSGKTISKAERSIIRNSVRPFSVVNPCKALKGTAS